MRSPTDGAGAGDSWELPNVGTGNGTQGLCKSSEHSLLSASAAWKWLLTGANLGGADTGWASEAQSSTA